MRTTLQRVTQASVTIDGTVVGSINHGITALVGFGADDTAAKIPLFLEKITLMRIFPNETGRFDKSLIDISGGLLLVPQFTLFADTSKGRRPEFFGALTPSVARPLFEELVSEAQKRMPGKVAAGVFGADMKVSLINDGPVTINLEL